jgi:hypothetical protein
MVPQAVPHMKEIVMRSPSRPKCRTNFPRREPRRAGGVGTDACFANLDAGVLDLVPPDLGEQHIDID